MHVHVSVEFYALVYCLVLGEEFPPHSAAHDLRSPLTYDILAIFTNQIT